MGYAGGTTPAPTYRRIGDHTECIQIDFDPSRISYAELLDEFFGMHDATRRAHSSQYASLILFQTEQEQETAVARAARFGELHGRPVLTQIRPLDRFHVAEDYHQKYGLRSDRSLLSQVHGYYRDEASLRESSLAMRLNGFAYSGGRASLLAREIESYGLSDSAQRHLYELAGRR